MTPEAVSAVLEGPCRLDIAGYRLAPLGDADIDDLYAHFGDPRVTEFLDIEPIEARFQTWDVIDWAEGVRGAGSGVRWSIRDGEGAFVGTCGFHRLTYLQARRGEVGYDLGPAHWGRGVLSRILPAVLAFGHDLLDLHRIEALVTPGNERSCRLLQRHGFEREGVLKGHGWWRGRYWDQVLFARLRDETQQARP
ncbi:GNAT family N-acetyltransferase [Phenylobacterium montanum]|uniref:GNAT family N-acetyltransferase n=1 Tax=Phenylobacterium montanum TaxID=2823693 RepID=A0A975IUA4_9CAUL|nr:GNAT family protein [Caulobacter sp. S6]QUD87737.1 GNAT family N-acetyltransferase [Caulobacter sp. S6]